MFRGRHTCGEKGKGLNFVSGFRCGCRRMSSTRCVWDTQLTSALTFHTQCLRFTLMLRPLGQRWQKGIMGVICYVSGVYTAAFSRPLTSHIMTNFQEHRSVSALWQVESSAHELIGGFSPVMLDRRMVESLGICAEVTVLTFTRANQERIRSDRIISHRRPLRHRTQDYLLKRSNSRAGK